MLLTLLSKYVRIGKPHALTTIIVPSRAKQVHVCPTFTTCGCLCVRLSLRPVLLSYERPSFYPSLRMYLLPNVRRRASPSAPLLLPLPYRTTQLESHLRLNPAAVTTTNVKPQSTNQSSNQSSLRLFYPGAGAGVAVIYKRPRQVLPLSSLLLWVFAPESLLHFTRQVQR